MDITANNKKIFTNQYLNGETVNYSVCFFTVSFLFIFLKQLLKIAFGLTAGISAGVSAVISAAVLFILENKYVFFGGKNKSLPKKILFYLFRCAVDFGFYKITSFLFTSVLDSSYALSFLLAGILFYFFNYYFDRLIVFDSISGAEKKIHGRCYRLFFHNRFIVASMLLSALCFTFVYLIFQLFPFGDMTVLRMDLYHQYGPLFVELYDRVTHFKSFIYSWTSGGGSSFLGNYFNYLSSPLSFIIFLFDRKDMPYAITTLVAVKGILSSSTFTYYLKKSQGRHSFASAAFGVFYAFCSYFLAYYWNIMWLDGMILFPLILLGIERIIRFRKPALYIASLTLMLWSSYYIGYMICLFSVVYFIAYFFMTGSAGEKIDPEFKTDKKNSIKKIINNKFINNALLFAGSSLLCGALCAAALIPVYFILQASSATSDTFPGTFESYFDLLNLVSSHLAGLETTIRSSGDDVLPNIYCSVLAVLLLPLYVMNQKIRLKEKAIYLLLILFFVFSFDNNCANFIWHALHFPNDLPYRFSFMYSFIILVIAFRSLMHIKAVAYRDIAVSGLLWVLVIMLFQKFPTNKMSELSIYITLAFVLIWTAVLLLIKKGKLSNTILAITVFAIAFCEVIAADSNSFLFTQKEKNYVENYDSYVDAVAYINENDTSFYRTELTYLGTRMDPCLYDYRGISTFSSMAYEQYSRNQYSGGMFGNRINSYTYNTQTPVYNMMYSLKYLIKAEESLAPSDELYSELYTTPDEKAAVYENKYFLPLAFEVSSDVEYWDNSEGNPFDWQQSFLSNAVGAGDVFIPVNYLSSTSDNIDCEDINSNGTYYFSKAFSDATSGSITINIEAVNDSNLYIYIDSPEIDNVNYYWNNDEESKYQNINEPYILDLGRHSAGDTITISLECGSMEGDASYFDIYAYNLDIDQFTAAYELLNLGAFQIDSFTETDFDGTVNAGYDGYLYTSIPYDEGWSIYIDGEKTEPVEIGDCQLGALITQGEHRVKLKYTPRGLKYGLLITAISYLGLIGYLVYRKRKRKISAN